MKNTGFTLIELLVVVLIIGILAAVAVPQYQLAVMKSKYTQLIVLADSFKKAEERYRMANGKYSFDFADLDVTPPAGWSLEMDGRYARSPDKKISCTLQDGSNEGKMLTVYCFNDTMMYFPASGQRLCGAYSVSPRGNQVCKSLGGTYAFSVSGGAVNYYTLP